MFLLEDCISFITKKAGKELSDNLEKRLSFHNITRTQWMALYYIKSNEEITQKKLAELLAIKESSIVRQLDKMELYGWIIRSQSKYDKRNKILILTDEGLKVEENIQPVVEEFKESAIKNIKEKDLETFKKVLSKMLDNIKY